MSDNRNADTPYWRLYRAIERANPYWAPEAIAAETRRVMDRPPADKHDIVDLDGTGFTYGAIK